MMLQQYSSRLLIVLALSALFMAAVAVAPASADSKTGRFLAGLAIGAIVGAALDDDCDRPRYCPPPAPYRRYDPPYYGGYGYNSPRQHYENGYRDGYSDGRYDGRRQGYRQGYADGRRDYSYGPYAHGNPPCW